MPMNHRLLVPRNSFTPLSIAGLGLWLDASDSATLTMNSSTVSQINDKSGNSRHYSQGTGANQPTLSTINGRVCLASDGSRFLSGNAAALNLFRNVAGSTLFVVGDTDTQDGTSRLFAAWSNNAVSTQTRVGLLNTTAVSGISGGGRRLDADSFTAVAYAHNANVHVFAAINDYTNTDAFVYEDGALVASNTSFQTAGSTSNTDSLAAGILGMTALTSIVGRIGSVLAWPRVLTATERAAVTRYLGSRWGVAVS